MEGEQFSLQTLNVLAVSAVFKFFVRLTVPPLCTPLAYTAEVDPQTICVPYTGILYHTMPVYSAQGGSTAPLLRKLPHDLRQPLHEDHVR